MTRPKTISLTEYSNRYKHAIETTKRHIKLNNIPTEKGANNRTTLFQRTHIPALEASIAKSRTSSMAKARAAKAKATGGMENLVATVAWNDGKEVTQWSVDVQPTISQSVKDAIKVLRDNKILNVVIEEDKEARVTRYVARSETVSFA